MTSTYTDPVMLANFELATLFDEIDRRIFQLEQMTTAPSANPVPGGSMTDPVYNSVTISTIGGSSVPVQSISSPPTALSLTTGSFFDSTFIDASWTPPADGSAQTYLVEWSKKIGGGYQTINMKVIAANNTRIEPVEPNSTYGVRITGRNRLDLPSTPLPSTGFTDITTGKDTSIPALVTGLTLTTGLRSVMVTWTDNSDPDVGGGAGIYQVELATNSAFTLNYISSRVSGTVAPFDGLITGATYYCRIRAIDSAGNAGPVSATTSAVVGPALGSDVDPATIRNNQTNYLVSAATGNPSTPASAFSTGTGDLTLVGTGLARATDAEAFNGTAISYSGTWTGTGTVPQTKGSYYRGLKPGKYKAVFYLKSSSTSNVDFQKILRVAVWTDAGSSYIAENGVWTNVLASDLGCPPNTAGTGTCDGNYHAVAVPFTILQDMSSVSGLQFYASSDSDQPTGNTSITYTRTWSLSHVVAVPFAALVQNEVVAQYLAAGSVVAGKAAINAISTENLTVGASTSSNAVANGGFEDALYSDPTRAAGWMYDWQVAGGTATFDLTGAAPITTGTKSCRILGVGSGVGSAIASKAIPVAPGDQWYVAMKARGNAATTGGLYFRIYYGTTENFLRTDTGVTLFDVVADGNFPSTATQYEAQVTVPTGVTWMRITLYGWSTPTSTYNAIFDDVVARKIVGTVQIRNGAVTAAVIGANQINSSHIDTVGLDAGVVKFGSMHGDRITTNTMQINTLLNATTLTSKTINIGAGGQFVIGSAPSAAGVVINSQGIRLYNSSGAVVVTLDVGGSASFTGAINSGSTITGTTISGSTVNSTGAVMDSNGLRIKGANQGGGQGFFASNLNNSIRFRDAGDTTDRFFIYEDASSSTPWLHIGRGGTGNDAIVELNAGHLYMYTWDGSQSINFDYWNSKYQLTGNGGAPIFSLVDAGASFTQAGFHPGFNSGNSQFNIVQNAIFNGWTDAVANSYVTTSSRRLKRNVDVVKGHKDTHARFRALKLHRYQRAHRDELFEGEPAGLRQQRHASNDRWRYGWVAEQLAPLFPEATHYDENNKPLGIDKGMMVDIFGHELQYAFERIESLEKQLAKSKGAR